MRIFEKVAGIVALAVVLGAGCSSPQPSTGTLSPSTTVATVSRPISPKEAAITLAQRMLDEAVLPPGVQPLKAVAPSVLRGPSSVPAMGNLEFAHRLFTVDQPPHAVYEWLQVHAPRGYVKAATSSGTDRGVPSWGVEDTLVVRPANISYADVQFGIAAGTSGQAVVRVDAVVGWTSPRPADEFVSARDRVVTVSVVHIFEKGLPVSKPVTTSDPKLVEPIVRAFNDLRVSPDSTHGCPAIGVHTVSYRVAFAPSRGATPDVVASIGSCGGVGVTVSGRAGPGLGDLSNEAFADAVAHVLGLSQPHFH